MWQFTHWNDSSLLVYFRVTRGQVLNCSLFLNKYAVSWRCFYTLDGRWYRAQTMLHRQQSRSRWAGFYTTSWWAAVAGTKQWNISVQCRLQCLWFDLSILIKLNVQCNLSTVNGDSRSHEISWEQDLIPSAGPGVLLILGGGHFTFLCIINLIIIFVRSKKCIQIQSLWKKNSMG